MKRGLLALFLLAATASLFGQAVKDVKPQPKEAPTPTPQAPKEAASKTKEAVPERTPDPNFVRWRVYLDTLAQEAKSVPDERRPYVTADVAAAYAEYDTDEALRLLGQAVDEAFRFRQQDPKKYEPMLDYVLRKGAKSGGDIPAALAARVKKLVEADKDNTAVKPYQSDRALMDGDGSDDLRRQAELAKSVAPRGLREGASVMNLVFNLAGKDQALADDVFLTYLAKAEADETIPPGALFQMEGYAFGYFEYRYFGDNNSTTNMGGDGKLKPVASLGVRFLSLMLRRIGSVLDKAEATGVFPGDPSTILAIIKVLTQDAEQTTIPAMVNAWQALEQRALIGRTPDQLRSAAKLADNILNNRARNTAPDPATEKQKAEDETDAMLADADKITGSCQRDLVYSRAAITLMTKSPKRAEEIIDKISDNGRATNIRDIMYSRRAEDLIEKDDLDTGTALIAKISSPSIKGVAMGHLAQVLIKNRQLQEGGKAADEAAKLFDKMDLQPERAAHLFGVAVTLLKADQRDAIAMLERGIKVFNKTDPQDSWRFANTMQVDLGCSDDQNNKSTMAWGGRFGGFNILDTVTAFAKEDLDPVNSTVDSIGDKPTKLRAQAIIAKAALAKYKTKK